jgi:hypothetical protein
LADALVGNDGQRVTVGSGSFEVAGFGKFLAVSAVLPMRGPP